MPYNFEAFQFLSRFTNPCRSELTVRNQHPHLDGVSVQLLLTLSDRQIRLDFCSFDARNPDIGPGQLEDPEMNAYHASRWPSCISVSGTVDLGPNEATRLVIDDLLDHIRNVIWHLKCSWMELAIPADQRSSTHGYRREFRHVQIFDMCGNRRPSPQQFYVGTRPGEPVGPGVVTFRDARLSEVSNELVWSPIIPFPDRTTFENDREQIARKIGAMRTLYNSHTELSDARRHAVNGEIRAFVRSLASAVEAALVHYQRAWSVDRPPRRLPFNEKIDYVLVQSGRQSYTSIDPIGSRILLDIYRCRNTMHEGDCYVTTSDGRRSRVRSIRRVDNWLPTVESFISWIESLA